MEEHPWSLGSKGLGTQLYLLWVFHKWTTQGTASHHSPEGMASDVLAAKTRFRIKKLRDQPSSTGGPAGPPRNQLHGLAWTCTSLVNTIWFSIQGFGLHWDEHSEGVELAFCIRHCRVIHPRQTAGVIHKKFFPLGPCGQLKLFQMVGLLTSVREEEWRKERGSPVWPWSCGWFWSWWGPGLDCRPAGSGGVGGRP